MKVASRFKVELVAPAWAGGEGLVPGERACSSVGRRLPADGDPREGNASGNRISVSMCKAGDFHVETSGFPLR